MNLGLDGVQAAVGREWSRFRSLLPPPGDPAWDGPTRLAGWTVRDLAVHVVWGTSMEADGLRRRGQGGTHRAQGRTVDAAEVDDEQLLGAVDGARDDLVEQLGAVTSEDLGLLAPLPYGDVPLSTFSQILVLEAGVHTSDLAAAVGDDDRLPPDVVAACQIVLALFLPVVSATAAERPPDGTTVGLRGESVDLRFRFTEGRWASAAAGDTPSTQATISGDDSTVLLFAQGRVPLADPRLAVEGDEAVAAQFKDWLPGL